MKPVELKRVSGLNSDVAKRAGVAYKFLESIGYRVPKTEVRNVNGISALYVQKESLMFDLGTLLQIDANEKLFDSLHTLWSAQRNYFERYLTELIAAYTVNARVPDPRKITYWMTAGMSCVYYGLRDLEKPLSQDSLYFQHTIDFHEIMDEITAMYPTSIKVLANLIFEMQEKYDMGLKSLTDLSYVYSSDLKEYRDIITRNTDDLVKWLLNDYMLTDTYGMLLREYQAPLYDTWVDLTRTGKYTEYYDVDARKRMLTALCASLKN